MLYKYIQNSVALKVNELNASTAAALATLYAADPAQANLSDRGVEFPLKAINDGILDASGKMVERIGANANSPYRSYFLDQTDSISDGGGIPSLSQSGAPVVGVIGAVRDSTTYEECEMVERKSIKIKDSLTLKVSPHYYATDNSRVWHTRTSVVADVCVWEAQAERYWLDSVYGVCPFPDSLTEAVVCGALSYLFRGSFNIEQAQVWKAYFAETLGSL